MDIRKHKTGESNKVNPKIAPIYRLNGKRGAYRDVANLPKLKRWYGSLAKPKRLEIGEKTTREELHIQSSEIFRRFP